MFTVTVGKSNVGVVVCAAVGEDPIVGVNVAVEVTVSVGVELASGVSVKVVVAVLATAVAIACSSVEGKQAERNKKINKMIL